MDSESDEDIDRNPNASPIPLGNKQKVMNDPRFEPKMSEVVEVSEPESSFKETQKKFPNGIIKSVMPAVVPEEDEYPPDRDDDISDDDRPEPHPE